MEQQPDDQAAIFRALTDSLAPKEFATDEDLQLIRQLAHDIVGNTPPSRHGSYGMDLPSGEVHVYSALIENGTTDPYSTALVEFYESDPETGEAAEKPTVRLLFDPHEATPTQLVVGDEDQLSDDSASTIVTLALEAAEHANSDIERAFYQHIAAIGTYHFMQAGELIVGYVQVGESRVAAADLARGIVLSHFTQQRVERMNSFLLSETTSLRVSTQDFEDIAEDTGEYYSAMELTELEVLHKGVRDLHVIITEDNEVTVSYDSDQEEAEAYETLGEEGVELLQTELGRDKLTAEQAERIIGLLLSRVTPEDFA
jgi:hypothetical protein